MIPFDIVWEPNSENCLDLTFAVPPCKKVIIVPYVNYITYAVRKFMSDMQSAGSFQHIGLEIWGQPGNRDQSMNCVVQIGKN